MTIYRNLGSAFGRGTSIGNRLFGFYAAPMHPAFHQRKLGGAGVDDTGMVRAVLFHGLRNFFDAAGVGRVMCVFAMNPVCGNRPGFGFPILHLVARLFRPGNSREQEKSKGKRRKQFGHQILHCLRGGGSIPAQFYLKRIISKVVKFGKQTPLLGGCLH